MIDLERPWAQPDGTPTPRKGVLGYEEPGVLWREGRRTLTVGWHDAKAQWAAELRADDHQVLAFGDTQIEALCQLVGAVELESDAWQCLYYLHRPTKAPKQPLEEEWLPKLAPQRVITRPARPQRRKPTANLKALRAVPVHGRVSRTDKEGRTFVYEKEPSGRWSSIGPDGRKLQVGLWSSVELQALQVTLQQNSEARG